MSDRSNFSDDSGEVRLAGYVGSELATVGQVLTADGNGGSTWSDVPPSGTIDSIASAGLTITVTDPTGPAVNLEVINAPAVGGIVVTGTPAIGNVLTATSTSAAHWAAPTGAISTVQSTDASVTVSGGTGPTVNLAVANSPKVGGIAVTGTPAIGNVPVATSTSAAAWAAPTPASQVLLATVVNGGTATFDVTGISGAYNDLILVIIARGDVAAESVDIGLRLNNDSGANYNYVSLRQENSATAGGTSPGQTSAQAGWCPAASATANRFCATEVRILGYANTSRKKSMTVLGGDYTTTHAIITMEAATWESTTAITRVTLFPTSGTGFVANSELRIYGRL
jgi:hypothetical protein